MRLITVAGVFLLLLCTSTSFAIGNIYVDGIGAFTQTIDAENEIGGGVNALFQISSDFNFFFKNIFNTWKTEEKASTGKKYDNKYRYFMSIAGVEYLYNISKMPLFWKNSVGIGAGSVNIREDLDPITNKYILDKSDLGLCLGVWTGVIYTFTQSISGFADVGFHKTFFFNELKDSDIMGVQILVGVRFTVWGVNKSIFSEY